MKKILIFIALAIIASGCGPPRIPQERSLFENNYFSISYPNNWLYGQVKKKTDYSENFYGLKTNEFEFKDEYYPRYHILVGVVEKKEDMFTESFSRTSLDQAALNFSNALLKSYAEKGLLVSKNFGNLSDISFNGIPAKFISLNVKDKDDKIKFNANSIYFLYSNKQYNITYVFYDDYNAITKTGLESVVYSLKPKK